MKKPTKLFYILGLTLIFLGGLLFFQVKTAEANHYYSDPLQNLNHGRQWYNPTYGQPTRFGNVYGFISSYRLDPNNSCLTPNVFEPQTTVGYVNQIFNQFTRGQFVSPCAESIVAFGQAAAGINAMSIYVVKMGVAVPVPDHNYDWNCGAGNTIVDVVWPGLAGYNPNPVASSVIQDPDQYQWARYCFLGPGYSDPSGSQTIRTYANSTFIPSSVGIYNVGMDIIDHAGNHCVSKWWLDDPNGVFRHCNTDNTDTVNGFHDFFIASIGTLSFACPLCPYSSFVTDDPKATLVDINNIGAQTFDLQWADILTNGQLQSTFTSPMGIFGGTQLGMILQKRDPVTNYPAQDDRTLNCNQPPNSPSNGSAELFWDYLQPPGNELNPNNGNYGPIGAFSTHYMRDFFNSYPIIHYRPYYNGRGCYLGFSSTVSSPVCNGGSPLSTPPCSGGLLVGGTVTNTPYYFTVTGYYTIVVDFVDNDQRKCSGKDYPLADGETFCDPFSHKDHLHYNVHPPTPTWTINPPTCFIANDPGTSVTITWTQSDKPITRVDVSQNPAFLPATTYSKTIVGAPATGSSTNGTGFFNGPTVLTWNPNIDYYVRTDDGTITSLRTNPAINVPPCAGPTIQSLKINNQSGSLGTWNLHTSGKLATETGSGWLNPLIIQINATPGAGTINQYYVGLSPQAFGTAGSLANLASKVNAAPAGTATILTTDETGAAGAWKNGTFTYFSGVTYICPVIACNSANATIEVRDSGVAGRWFVTFRQNMATSKYFTSGIVYDTNNVSSPFVPDFNVGSNPPLIP